MGDDAGPNFFIVGAMKAGTSSICRYLAQHPQVFISRIKEPNYYVWENLEHRDRYLVPCPSGLAPIELTQLVRTRDQYSRLFAKASFYQARGEASPLYLPHLPAAARIKRHHPDARIIALLRNPVTRAYSAYSYRRAHGLEPAESFTEALQAELTGQRASWSYDMRYLETGHYARQVTHYLEAFGGQHTLILNFDHLRSEADAVCRRVLDHLSLSTDASIRTDFIANKTRHPSARLTSKIMALLDWEFPFRQAVKRAVPMEWRHRIRVGAPAAVSRFGKRPPKMSDADHRFLIDYYADEISELERLTGWQLGHWRQIH